MSKRLFVGGSLHGRRIDWDKDIYFGLKWGDNNSVITEYYGAVEVPAFGVTYTVMAVDGVIHPSQHRFMMSVLNHLEA